MKLRIKENAYMPPELDLVKLWLSYAKDDMRSALALSEISPSVNIQVCFHCQQSVEKSLKAYLIYNQINFRCSHDIDYLLSLCLETDNSFDAIKHIQELTYYAVRTRYPGDAIVPTDNEKKSALTMIDEVYEFVLYRLPKEVRSE